MKTTNWVTTICTILNIVLVHAGLPIPVETLVEVGMGVQAALTLVARNREEIAGVTGWGWLAYGKK